MTTVQTPRPAPTRSLAGGPAPRGGGTASVDPFRVVRRHIIAIAASAVFGLLFGVIMWFTLARLYPLYSSTITFEIIPALEDPNQTTTGELTQEDAVIRFARTEMMFLLERDVLREAMSDRDVWEQTNWAQQYVTNEGTRDIDEAVDDLQDDLKLRYITDTNLFEVKWSAKTRADVPIVLNSIRSAYLKKRRQQIDSEFGRDLDIFLRDEKTLGGDIENLELSIEEYVNEHGILTLNQIRDHPLATEVNALNAAIASAHAERIMLMTQQQQVAAKLGGEFEPTAEDRARAESDPVVRQLASQIAMLDTRRREFERVYGPESRNIREVEIQLESAEDAFEAKVHEVTQRDLNASLKSVTNMIETYASMIAEKKVELADKDEQLREIAGKVAKFESMERRRNALHQQLERAGEAVQGMKMLKQRASANRVRAYPPAETPREKAFPKAQMMIPLGFILVVGLTVGIIFLRELTDKRVKSAADLSLVPGARVLGVIPELEEDPTRIEQAELAIRKGPRSVVAESYRQTCTPIVKSLQERGHQSLVVVGGLPGSGSTTAVSNIVAFMAVGGQRVLAIDANFRRPRLTEALGVTDGNARGLGDVLQKDAQASDVIVNAGDGIDLIAAGTPASRVFERLNNGVFDTMLAELRTRYDYIVIDAPPAIVAGDALVLANKCDASVLVVRAAQEHKGLVARLINQFNAAQAEFIGVVLNRPRFTAGGYFKKNYATMAEYSSAQSA